MALLPQNTTVRVPSVVCFEIFQRHMHRGESQLSLRCLFNDESLTEDCALEVRLHGRCLAFREETAVTVGDVVTVVFGPGAAGQHQRKPGRRIDIRTSVRVTIAATLLLRPEVQFEESVHGHTVHRTTSTTTSIFHREAHSLRLLADELARGPPAKHSSSDGTERKRTRHEVAPRGSTESKVSVAEGGASSHRPGKTGTQRSTLAADTAAAVRHLQRTRPQKQIPPPSRAGPNTQHQNQPRQDAIRSSSPALPVDALSAAPHRSQKRALTSAMFRNASTARLLSSGAPGAKSSSPVAASSTSRVVASVGPIKRKASVGEASGAVLTKRAPHSAMQADESGREAASEPLPSKVRHLGRAASSESPVASHSRVTSVAAEATQPAAVLNQRKRKVPTGPGERAFAFFQAFVALWLQPMCSLAATEGLLCDTLSLKDLRRSCGVDAERNLLRALDMTNGKYYSRLLNTARRPESVCGNSGGDSGAGSHSKKIVREIGSRRRGGARQSLALAELQPALLGKRLAVNGGLTAIGSIVPAFAAPDTGVLFHFLQSCG